MWWKDLDLDALTGRVAHATEGLSRLSLGRLLGLADDERATIRPLGIEVPAVDADGAHRVAVSHAVRPEDGRALTVRAFHARVTDRVRLCERGGREPAPGSDLSVMRDLVAAAPVLDPETARTIGRRVRDGYLQPEALRSTAACVTPYGVARETLWVRAGELSLALGQPRALGEHHPAALTFLRRCASAVRQPAYARSGPLGLDYEGIAGIAHLREGFGHSLFRGLVVDPRVVAAIPGGAEALLALRPVSKARDVARAQQRLATPSRGVAAPAVQRAVLAAAALGR